MEVTLDPNDLRGWVPIRFYRQGEHYLVDWCHIGSERFTRPFFEDTVNACLRRPFSLLFRHQTPIEFLGETMDRSPGLKPTGFIFHSSRCGSTLVSQMLASCESNVVISEPPPIDSILRANGGERVESREQRARWLKWMVNAIGQRRNVPEENLFIKFDSWSILCLDVVRTAFPDVPWVFLYREPVEVIASQMEQRGVHMIPGMIPGILPDVDTREIDGVRHEEFCARVLARICRSALEHAGDPKGLFLNYSSLPDTVTTVIVDHFGVKFAPSELERMRLAARYNAKTPQLDFEPDTAKKKAAASAQVREEAFRWVEPVYRELEEISEKALTA